jgi:uncharacterized membrane protein YgaE (UPF0421/DUF939 family)
MTEIGTSARRSPPTCLKVWSISEVRHAFRPRPEPLAAGRRAVRARAESLAAVARPLAHTAIAAAAAWLVATELLGHSDPFFAPVAAVLTLGLSANERLRRAIEVTLGVALGIAVADALVLWLGTGTISIAVVVLLAMAAVRMLGGGPLATSQAAISAVLVATIQPPVDGLTFERALDALVGGVSGLVVASVVFPIDPPAVVRRAIDSVFDVLSETLAGIGEALRHHDRERAEAELARARSTDGQLEVLRESAATAAESGRLSVARSSSTDRLGRYLSAADEVELAIRNTRVLARSAVRVISLESATPEGLALSCLELAKGAELASQALEDPTAVSAARSHLATAARMANAVAREHAGEMSIQHLVGQIRLTGFDLARALGTAEPVALALVRAGS